MTQTETAFLWLFAVSVAVLELYWYALRMEEL
jgi:hypothetical protein